MDTSIGAPGKGKTGLREFICSALKQALAGTEFGNNDIFDYTGESEYWEGYNGQMFLSMDDLFQDTSDATQMARMAVSIIRMCNDTPFPLNMAEIKSKGNTYFQSKFIISTG